MKPSRRTWVVFWIVTLGVVALISWGEWMELRRRRFVMERVEALEQKLQETGR